MLGIDNNVTEKSTVVICRGLLIYSAKMAVAVAASSETVVSIYQTTRCHTLLTYLLTPWSRVLLEKLTGFAANQEIPRILGNPKVHHPTHKDPLPVPILSQLHPVPTTPSNFLKIHLNINLPSTSWSPQWSLSLRFPHQNLVHTSPFLHMCPYAPPVSFFSILSTAQYWVRSTDH